MRTHLRTCAKFLLRHDYDTQPLGTVGVHEVKRRIMHRLVRKMHRKFQLDLEVRQLQRLWSDMKRRNHALIQEVQEEQGHVQEEAAPAAEEEGQAIEDLEDPEEGSSLRCVQEAGTQTEEPYTPVLVEIQQDIASLKSTMEEIKRDISALAKKND
ncbi:hypothetical protein XELAEV_18035276mg [Xenopus laevis]|uniref:Uncharacterized protein n=1 Tax=Xenopus laevis TaxID=8355 RepID=A0A974HBX1_XENLA|nr:hypothetical protein XELAEV_18035276mg [Xenopus laevis]